MKGKYDRQLRQEIQAINEMVKAAPISTRNKISNRCRKISLIFRKMQKEMDTKDKYIARHAIFDAMLNGRKLSQMDCREFEVEDMRTPMSHMRKRFEQAGYILCDRWIRTPKGRRIKEYWLEKPGYDLDEQNTEYAFGHDVGKNRIYES